MMTDLSISYRSGLAGVLLLALCIVAVSACSSSPDEPDTAPVEEITEPDEFERLTDEAAAAYQNRGDSDELRRAIDLWNRALELTAEDSRRTERAAVSESLAKAHYFAARYQYSDGPIPAANPDVENAVDAGLTHAERALEIRAPEIWRAIDHGAPFEAEFPDPPDGAAASLLWYAKHLHLRAQIGDVSTAAASLPVADALMQMVLERNPELHFGAASRYFAVRHIDRPMRRSSRRSSEAFERSLDIAPDFLPTRLLRVRHLATFNDEPEVFERELRAIADIPPDRRPGAEPENAAARRWAAEMLEHSDEFFD